MGTFLKVSLRVLSERRGRRTFHYVARHGGITPVTDAHGRFGTRDAASLCTHAAFTAPVPSESFYNFEFLIIVSIRLFPARRSAVLISFPGGHTKPLDGFNNEKRVVGH